MTRLGKISPFGWIFLPWAKFFQELIYYWAISWAKFYLLWANFFPSLFTIGQIFSEIWANFFSNCLVTLPGFDVRSFWFASATIRRNPIPSDSSRFYFSRNFFSFVSNFKLKVEEVEVEEQKRNEITNLDFHRCRTFRWDDYLSLFTFITSTLNSCGKKGDLTKTSLP